MYYFSIEPHHTIKHWNPGRKNRKKKKTEKHAYYFYRTSIIFPWKSNTKLMEL